MMSRCTNHQSFAQALFFTLSATLEEFLFSLLKGDFLVLLPHPILHPSHNTQNESKLCSTGTLLYCILYNFTIIIALLLNMTVHDYNV